jgi:hypothetical protein
MDDSEHLLIVAQVPPIGISLDTKYLGGDSVSIANGQIVERYGPGGDERSVEGEHATLRLSLGKSWQTRRSETAPLLNARKKEVQRGRS